MPILPSEPSLFPPDLFTAEDSEVGRHWYVLRTKPRQEKSLARELLAREIPFYLPLIPHTRSSGGRRTKSFLPMFTSYVFLRGTDDERVLALTTNRIIQTLPVDEPDQLTADLDRVQRLIELDVPLSVESQLSKGQLVRIKSGLFEGFEGVIIRRVKKYRLQIAVNYLQQGVSVEIDDSAVEAL